MKDSAHNRVLLPNGIAVLLPARLQLTKQAVAALQAAVEAGAAGFVLRGAPNQAGYYVDPITLQATAADMGLFAAREDALAAIGGFDTRMGCAAATDAVLRLAAVGKATCYVPQAEVPSPETLSYAQKLLCSLKLRLRYGNTDDIKEGIVLLLKALKHPGAYATPRSVLLGQLFGSAFSLVSLLFTRMGNGRKYKNTVSMWYGAEMGFVRGALEMPAPATQPLVSIITRTRHRPETLRLTLQSLRHQTYQNLQIVVVEDGEPMAEQMIREDFADLPITYHATVTNIGRAAAFNKGVSLAKGEYLNMLDDDDYLLPEHIELAVAAAQQQNVPLVFLQGMALETEKTNDAPYRFDIKALRPLDFPRVEPFTMVRRCVATEHGVFFKRTLCLQAGGMREELHAHEDWNLWLRMMALAGRWHHLRYTTNCYIVPFDKEAERQRLEKYAVYNDALLEDDTLVFPADAKTLAAYRRSMADDYAYLLSLGLAEEQLQKECAEAKAFFEKYSEEKLPAFDLLTTEPRETLSGKQLKGLYLHEVQRYHTLMQENKMAECYVSEGYLS